MNIRILLIEDNTAIAEQLCSFLETQKFQVDYTSNGRQALNLISNNKYDVILLDLMLPDINGIDLCRRIKTSNDISVPILMLTARDSLSDKGEGFDAGADDYLTKPFELQEVAMRCIALTRRQQLHHSNKLVIGDLKIDIQQRTVARQEKAIRLSIKDFEILVSLAKAYPNPVTRTELIEKIWGDEFPDSDVLRTHIYTLRNSIDKSFEFPMIKTIHGVGFKLETINEK